MDIGQGNPMLYAPTFQDCALVTDDALLAAQVSALFTRQGRYFPVMDGPRLGREDAENETIRRRNALVLAGIEQVLIGGLPDDAAVAMAVGWPRCAHHDAYPDLKAIVGGRSRSRGALHWGKDNLGVGVYQARLSSCELVIDLDASPEISLVSRGQHLLVVFERGDALAEVIASNIAFASNASFATIPELAEELHDHWIEDIYDLGEGGEVSARFNAIVDRARQHVGALELTGYQSILFVTAGFPWGVIAPHTAVTHMYRYPDFGRSTIEGIWASQGRARSTRTALLVDPGAVESAEMVDVAHALYERGALVRTINGSEATPMMVQFLLDLVPYDVIVISSHSGDAQGHRLTYEFPDLEGKCRRLVVDRALSFSYDRVEDMFRVMEYYRFHSLDGVSWRDKAGKDALPVGSAMLAWRDLGGLEGRNEYLVASEEVGRVPGSMGIQMHGEIMLFASHAFAMGSAPLFFNNSCWSWHELSMRATFAGARGYIGSLYPVVDPEAQEVARALFASPSDVTIPVALWRAQQHVYGSASRRPYVMVGLPYLSLPRNEADSIAFLLKAYRGGRAAWAAKAQESAHEDVRRNAARYERFLREDEARFHRQVRALGMSVSTESQIVS
jgi:hypothetical protein